MKRRISPVHLISSLRASGNHEEYGTHPDSGIFRRTHSNEPCTISYSLSLYPWIATQSYENIKPAGDRSNASGIAFSDEKQVETIFAQRGK